ncbi:MAG: EAL domain-containing protein [Actinomycetota bacterium]|nr:EAL domain-containing protein [Actinomycetota bacterium]
MTDSGPTTGPSLRRTWSVAVAILMAAVLGLGVLAGAAVQYQRSAFEQTTNEFEAMSLLGIGIEDAIQNATASALVAMFTPPGSASFDEVWATYEESDARLRTVLALAGDRIEPGIGDETFLDEVSSTWDEIDVLVREAPDRWADGELGVDDVGLTSGLFGEVWTRVQAIRAAVSAGSEVSMTDLWQRAEETARVQRLILPAVVAAVSAGLAAALWSARRMRRRVVEPILALQLAAHDIGAGRGAGRIDVQHACAELEELATTLSASAQAITSSHAQLRDQAHTDALTGLPNRKAFIEDLAARLAAPAEGVGVLFVDLDDFKIVNDSMGHAAGDHLLRVVSQRLGSIVRDDELVARLGGDEFAVRVGGISAPAGAVAVAERVLGVLAEPIVIEGVPVTVGCSIGIAVSGRFGGVDGVDELMRNADFAMYIAKSQGKNRFEVFAASMHEEMLTRTDLSRDLARAVELDQLELHYQPIVDLTSLDVLGFEALVRWRHPARGLLAPGAFIEIAESTGDIVDIGAWVVDRACADLAELTDAVVGEEGGDGAERVAPWMSVNVSARQLGDELVDVVRDALGRHGVEPDHLVLEITESVATANNPNAVASLAALRDLGVHVALDDFGVGFSSLRQLQDLPVDVIKIDRAFVATAGAGPMIEAIISLGERLGLDVIAEGIEERDELERLRELGAVAGQGYLFARPAPREELEAARSGDHVTADG